MKPGFWATLDLDPTTDRSAIRRAYAARLKAMDVDADPEGFATLRAARDLALAHAADPVPEPEYDPYDAEEAEDALDAAAPTVEEPRVDPELAALHDAIDAHFRALQGLLFANPDAEPTAEERAAIEHHGRALLADPRLEQVDFATDAERWFAEVLAAAIPRADPLLEPAAATFGWIARRDDYTLLPDAQTIVARIGATRYATLLDDPEHRLHKAWRELTRGDGGRRNWFVARPDVEELLTTVRHRFPDAEGWMNPVRVGMWSKAPVIGPRIGIRWWVILIVVVTVLRVVASFVAEPSQSVRPTADTVVQALTGQRIDKVRSINPGLAKAVEQAVEETRSDDDAPSATSIAQRLLTERLAVGIDAPPRALLLELTRWDLDQMRNAQAENPAACPAVNLLVPGVAMASNIADRQRALLRKVILYAREGPAAGTTYRFLIAGDVIDKVIEHTGLPAATIRRALQAKEPAATRCKVDIALREIGLTAPDDIGLPLLRDLQPLIYQGPTEPVDPSGNRQ